jgi:hypothetical protein
LEKLFKEDTRTRIAVTPANPDIELFAPCFGMSIQISQEPEEEEFARVEKLEFIVPGTI